MKRVGTIAFHLLILYLFYYVGTFIQKSFSLFIPGSMIGMLLLFALLYLRIFPKKLAEEGSLFILRHMPLLFLPVTVGILQFLDVFSGKGFFIVIIAIVSTVLIIATVGIIGERLMSRKEVER